MSGTSKINRILNLFYRLNCGEKVNKSVLAIEHNVNERSIDRDIEDIRLFLSDFYRENTLCFDKTDNTYYFLEHEKVKLSGVKVLCLLKILLSSRAFAPDELKEIVLAINSLLSWNEKNAVILSMENEMQHYIPLQHNKAMMKIQWDLNKCILNRNKIHLTSMKLTGEKVQRCVLPLSIIFSEFYFYLIAFIDNEKYEYPAFFRIDRIDSFEITEQVYDKRLLYKYNVAKMCQCMQFMYAGELMTIKLRCSNLSMEAVKDRLPNYKILSQDKENQIVKAKVFDNGFIKWVLSQENQVEVLEPKFLREKIKEEAENILKMYD